jgi:hypothetical protein
MGETRNAYRILVGKRPLGRPRRRWVDNIKMDIREIGWGGVDWMDMAQDRDQWRTLVNTVLKSVKLSSPLIIIFKTNVINRLLLQKMKQMNLMIQNESLVSIMTLNYLT